MCCVWTAGALAETKCEGPQELQGTPQESHTEKLLPFISCILGSLSHAHPVHLPMLPTLLTSRDTGMEATSERAAFTTPQSWIWGVVIDRALVPHTSFHLQNLPRKDPFLTLPPMLSHPQFKNTLELQDWMPAVWKAPSVILGCKDVQVAGFCTLPNQSLLIWTWVLPL